MECRDFFYKLGKIIYRIDSRYTNFAKQENVKANLLWIMYALSDNKSHTQKAICEEWDLPLTTINTIVKYLENQGFVKLIKVDGKRREMNIALTDEGKKFSDKLLKGLFDLEKQVFENIKKDADDIISKLTMLEKEIKETFDKK